MGEIRQLVELTRVRLLLFVREPEALFWVFGFPLLLAVVLGFAFRRSEIRPSSVRVLAGAGAEELLERRAREPPLEAELALDRAVAERDLRRGKVDALLLPGEQPVLRLDPQRPDSETARLRVLLALGLGGEEAEDALLRLEAVEERGSRYVDFLFPGLLGLNLMGTGMWSIGFSVAEMRQKKILKRLLVTPMRRSSFLFSFLLARLVFLVLEVSLLLGFGILALDVPFESSVPAFGLVCVLGAAVFSGLGLLATARTRTIQGASGMLNLMMMPMWLLSGVFFSYERFPEFLHPVLRLLPLTALVDGLRAGMLEGQGLIELAPGLLILAVWGACAYALAIKLFRWQ